MNSDAESLKPLKKSKKSQTINLLRLNFICVDEAAHPSSIIKPLMSHCASCGIGAID